MKLKEIKPVKVLVTKLGFYDGSRRRPGEVLILEASKGAFRHKRYDGVPERWPALLEREALLVDGKPPLPIWCVPAKDAQPVGPAPEVAQARAQGSATPAIVSQQAQLPAAMRKASSAPSPAPQIAKTHMEGQTNAAPTAPPQKSGQEQPEPTGAGSPI